MLGWFSRGAPHDDAPQSSDGAAEANQSAQQELQTTRAAIVGLCPHNVATRCRSCEMIGRETRRLAALPAPMWLPVEEHVVRLIRWLREQRQSGHILSADVSQTYDEMCDHDRIEPIAKRVLLKELASILERSLMMWPPGNGRKTKRTVYFLPFEEDPPGGARASS